MSRRRLVNKKRIIPTAPAPLDPKPVDALQPAVVSETASDRQNLENTQAASQAELPQREPEGGAAPASEAPAAEAEAPTAEPEADVVPPAAPPPPAPAETPGPPPSLSSAPASDPTKPPVPERTGPPVDASADRADRVADGEGAPTTAESKPVLANAFETPSGADWFLQTGSPAPAREDMGQELSGDPTQITAPVRRSPSPVALLIGALTVIGLCCMAALAFLVWLLVG